MYPLLCKPRVYALLTLSYLPCHNNLKCYIVNDTKLVVVNHLPISVAFGVLFPSFMLNGRSKILNTFKKGIYKIVMLQIFFSILSLSLTEIVLAESVGAKSFIFVYRQI